MTILSTATKGRITRPHLMLLYGTDGVGKSTFAAAAPAPIFLSAEEGTNHLDVTRVAVRSLADFRAALTELAAGGHAFKTVVVDTLDWLETLVYADVCSRHEKQPCHSIEDIPYGKGRVKALETWKDLLPLVSACRDKGLNFIAIAHSFVKKFEDPATPQGYERYQLKLQQGASTDVAALWREYVDTVLFATFEVSVTKDDTRRGFGDGSRVLYTERRPAFDAKNRLGLPFQIPLDWTSYAKAAAKGEEAAQAAGVDEVVTAEVLLELAAQVADAARRAKVEAAIAEAGTDQAKLANVKRRLLVHLNNGKK